MSSPPDDQTAEVPGDVRPTDPASELPSPPADGGRPNFLNEFLASIVVFLVALPLCMGIALASGVPVAAGLITGIIGGIIVGVLAGSPLQVSGPAAGLAVIMYQFVDAAGLEFLGLAVLMGGILQAAAGLAKVGVWFRAVSPAVVEGMLAGIGVLIFASQFHVMVDDDPKKTGIQNIVTIPEAIQKGLPWPTLEDKETRDLVTGNVREVGTLHEMQVRIRETIQEHRSSEEIDPDFDLAGVRERQAEVAGRLAAVSTTLTDTAAMQGKNGPRRQETLASAKAAVTAAVDQLSDSDPEANAVFATQLTAEDELLAFEKSLKNHDWAAKVGLLTILVIVVWRFLPGPFKAVPAPLAAIIAATAVAWYWSLPVLYVEVPDSLTEELRLPTMSLLERADWGLLIKTAVVIAVIASAETLLCATAVDAMHTGPRTNYDKELFAQGVGNTLCGLVGSLPMTGVIVRSSANVQAGAKTRWSAVMHGAWLLGLVAFAPGLLRMIPVSGLAAILVYTGVKLMGLGKLPGLYRAGKGELAIFLTTVATIVATDLLTGVLIGIGLAAVLLLRKFTNLHVRSEAAGGETTVHLAGAATFVGLPKILEHLEKVPAGSRVKVDVEELTFMDHACLQLLEGWERQHQSTGGSLQLDWRSVPDKPLSPADGRREAE